MGAVFLVTVLLWSAHSIFGSGDNNDDISIYIMYTMSKTQRQEFHMHYLA